MQSEAYWWAAGIAHCKIADELRLVEFKPVPSTAPSAIFAATKTSSLQGQTQHSQPSTITEQARMLYTTSEHRKLPLAQHAPPWGASLCMLHTHEVLQKPSVALKTSQSMLAALKPISTAPPDPCNAQTSTSTPESPRVGLPLPRNCPAKRSTSQEKHTIKANIFTPCFSTPTPHHNQLFRSFPRGSGAPSAWEAPSMSAFRFTAWRCCLS
jgi:hypothetical protein